MAEPLPEPKGWKSWLPDAKNWKSRLPEIKAWKSWLPKPKAWKSWTPEPKGRRSWMSQKTLSASILQPARLRNVIIAAGHSRLLSFAAERIRRNRDDRDCEASALMRRVAS